MEDVLALDENLHGQALAVGGQALLHGVEVGDGRIQRHHHGHGEHAALAENRLGDVVDVGAAVGQRRGDGSHHAGAVLAKDGDDALHGKPSF